MKASTPMDTPVIQNTPADSGSNTPVESTSNTPAASTSSVVGSPYPGKIKISLVLSSAILSSKY